MKTLALLLAALCLLSGCDAQAQSGRVILKKHDYGIKEVCIDGVVYLIFDQYNRGGITPKINADFYPYTCVTNQQQGENNG